MRKLLPIIQEQDSDRCRIVFADADREHDLYGKARTLPCLARWVFPTIGFDGWLYHCSQSAATNFRSMALGNLRERGFWDIFYDYDLHSMTEAEKMMAKLGCRCDRKAHLVNGRAEK
jgi:MoaA/NifB/PqqE/SkfB family radical SAM enzyme